MLEAGKDPDERLLHVVHGGEQVHRLTQLVRVRLLHQLQTIIDKFGVKALLCRWFRFAQLAKGKKSRP